MLDVRIEMPRKGRASWTKQSVPITTHPMPYHYSKKKSSLPINKILHSFFDLFNF